MAASREVTLFVLLLYGWQQAELQPINMTSVSSTELPSNLRNLDDDIATVVDEILVQEMLDPNKSTLLETQRLSGKSTKITKEKKEEKETIYQMKSLEALEKIIASLRRALGKHLKQRRKKQKSLFKGAKQHKRKESLN